jgi:Wax ester synthase-like Acyl-CoA acyltransferase domain
MDAFPLPLVPIESLLARDARPDFPMVFYIVVDVSGRLDRQRLVKAFELARRREPLLSAVVTRQRSGFQWRAAPPEALHPDRAIEFVANVEQMASGAWRGFDLAREPGLRMTVVSRGEAHQLILHFHHACTDGVGALAWLADLLSAYDQLGRVASHAVALRPLHVDGLLLRARTGRSFLDDDAESEAGLPLAASFAPTLRRFALALPSPIAGASSVAPRGAGPPYRGFTLDAETLRRLRAVARAADAQLNDLLLAELFLTLHARQPTDRRWRISMPVNLRTARHSQMPAANVFGYSFLSRASHHCRNAEMLLAGLAWETRLVRKHRLARHFLQGVARAARTWGALPLIVRLPICYATAVLSNVGDPARRMPRGLRRHDGKLVAGRLVVENIRGAPPVRPRTRLAACFTRYAGQLSCLATTCPRSLGEEASDELLAAYEARLRARAEEIRRGSAALARERGPATAARRR